MLERIPAKAPSADQVYQDLKRRLLVAEFSQNEKLRPDSLKQEYDCAAATVREALFRLFSERLIDFQDQRGFRTLSVSERAFDELTSLRSLIEGEGLRLSIANGDLAWEADLTAAHHKLSHVEGVLRDNPDALEYHPLLAESEWHFHRMLVAACGSDTLIEAHGAIYERQRVNLVQVVGRVGYRDGNIDEHAEILSAALARDATLCLERLDSHLHRMNVKSPKYEGGL
ncbi:MAG: FCD domain-containing protein [Pseudomonadota bacterium]